MCIHMAMQGKFWPKFCRAVGKDEWIVTYDDAHKRRKAYVVLAMRMCIHMSITCLYTCQYTCLYSRLYTCLYTCL